jgi:5-methylcytosine-specific restriction endonuclease McrA
MQRRFTGRQRTSLYLASEGRCAQCQAPLDITDWHADHVKPFSRGGMTDETNGQALCTACNLKKGSKDAGER